MVNETKPCHGGEATQLEGFLEQCLHWHHEVTEEDVYHVRLYIRVGTQNMIM